MSIHSARPNILIVDDDELVRKTINIQLRANYNLTIVAHPHKAIELIQANHYDLIITDYLLPEMTGIELLNHVRRHQYHTPIIIMTAEASIATAIRAIQDGASDYLQKPLVTEHLDRSIRRAIAARDMTLELNQLKSEKFQRERFNHIVGTSTVLTRCFDFVNSIASTDAIVLITGETGVGKELFARSIHSGSPRSEHPLVAVNCAALPNALLESELFGHEKGSFTGATRLHKGKFEQAGSGTIFLDEIGEMDIQLQAKLLRVLQFGEYNRIGGYETKKIACRVLTATNQDLRELVERGLFREDLYYRINILELRVPSLRERIEDLPLLVEHFNAKFSSKHGKPKLQISALQLNTLQQYEWPGNIRELENLIERSVILNESPTAFLSNNPEANVSSALSSNIDNPTLTDKLREIERQMIIDALNQNNNIQARAAEDLGISRSNLHQRMKRLEISRFR